MMSEPSTKIRKLKIARLWGRYEGGVLSRTPIITKLARQHETICLYLKKRTDEPNVFEAEGLTCYYLSNKSYFRMFNLPVLLRLAGILRREKVDILHCHRHQASVYGTLAARLAGVPVILSQVHGLNRGKAKRRRFINKIILPKNTRIITTGESIRSDVLECNPFLDPDRIISEGNSIDVNKFTRAQVSNMAVRAELGINADAFVFGMVGRLDPTKGVEYLLRAFKRVLDKYGSADLLLIGRGRCREELEQLADNLGIAPRVHFLGQRDDVVRLYRVMDCFIMPSVAEGLSRALLEALASGVPCIGSRVGGNVEILDNGIGELFNARDDEALAELMLNIMQWPQDIRRQRIERGREDVKAHYTHERIIALLDKLYRDLYAESQRHNTHV